MPLGLGAAAVIGSGVATAGNLLANERSYKQQERLDKIKYKDYVEAMHGVGATPTSTIQGLVGSGVGSVPAASSSNNPVSDFGQSLSSGVSAEASLKQAVAAQDNATAALTNAETERTLALMKLRFEPAKYFADIRKSLAEAFQATKNAFLHGSMQKYYEELTKDVLQVRPWKLAGLRQGLLNDMATFGKILQETKTSKALEGYYKSGAYELATRAEMNLSQKEKNYAEAWNEHLRGFRIQWENTLLSYGIDPTKPFWENIGRLMYTNPKIFKDRMDMFISGLNLIDNRLQLNLGEHYKRNITAGYGLYKLNQIHQKNANSRSFRNNNAVSTISKIIPILGGVPIPAVGESGPGVDWWLKD